MSFEPLCPLPEDSVYPRTRCKLEKVLQESRQCIYFFLRCSLTSLKALAEAALRCFYLQRSGEEVVLRDNIYKEVRWNFPKLVVKHRDESQEQLFTLLYRLLCPAQQTEEVLPVFKAFVCVSKQETHKGKLQLT